MPLRQMPLAVIFDSENCLNGGRYDILTADPAQHFNSKHTQLDANADQDDTKTAFIKQIVTAIEKHTSFHTDNTSSESEQVNHLPFIAGAIGLLSYNFGEQQHNLNNANSVSSIYIGIYQWALVQDHLAKKSWLVADPKLKPEKWKMLCQLIKKVDLKATQQALNNFKLHESWSTSLPIQSYAKAFIQAKAYIQAGDCYQVNLTRRFSNRYSGDSYSAFLTLKNASSAPFSAYLETENYSIACCSPERFIQIHDGHVLTQPIKGTRPRGKTDTEDTAMIKQLSESVKDRAENLMIVDLMRNDIGKHCITGSVTAPQLFQIESFANVHHMVSSVRGNILANNLYASLTLLFSCMPGGSVTGAPKKRAMEIIRELEPCTRSIYCGSLFYLNRDGNLDSNILIRSLFFDKQPTSLSTEANAVHCWGGGGIVSDSVMVNEFQESYYKVSNLLDALQNAHSNS